MLELLDAKKKSIALISETCAVYKTIIIFLEMP